MLDLCSTYMYRSAAVCAPTGLSLTISATGEHHFYCVVRSEIVTGVLQYCTRRFVKCWKVQISASPRSPPEQRRPLAAYPPPSFFIANAHRRAGAAGGRPENSGRRIREEREEPLDHTYAASRTNTCQALLRRDREVRTGAGLQAAQEWREMDGRQAGLVLVHEVIGAAPDLV